MYRRHNPVRRHRGFVQLYAEGVKRILTMYFGPDTVLLAMDLRFRKNLSGREMEESVKRMESKIRLRHDKIKHIFIESDSLTPQAEPPLS